MPKQEKIKKSKKASEEVKIGNEAQTKLFNTVMAEAKLLREASKGNLNTPRRYYTI